MHEPRAAELVPNASLQAIFDIGARVGARARAEFADAVLIELDHRRVDDAIEATQRALDNRAPTILEASFREDSVFVAVDALTRDGDAHVLTEIKATARLKPQHIPDAAIQAHVVERAGLPVVRVEIMHLNTNHRHPNQGPLFLRTDITDDVAEMRPGIAAEIEAQLEVLEGALPYVEPGDHCVSPYACPFFERCHVPLTDHAIEELNGIRKKQLGELRDAGIDTIDQIPSDFPLRPLHARHRTAVQDGHMVVEPGLREILGRYAYPIAMLDFETVAPALPVWDGCSPFGQVPVQFSVHMVHANGEVTHRGYLAEEALDPRSRVAEELAEALDDAATILAWNAPFERRCLGALAEASPAHATALRQASDKIEDLLPVVRDHLYHPDFRGSFSIKNVAAALLPNLRYDDLEVADGQTASWQLETLLCRPEERSAEERDGMRRALEAYCKRDTEVMVALFRFLIDSSA